MATADGSGALVATGSAFQYVEDLTRSVWKLSVDRLAAVVELYSHEIAPQSYILQMIVDLQGIWEKLGQPADAYIGTRFLKPGIETLVNDFGFTYNGGAIRLNLVKHVQVSLPPGVAVIGTGGPQDAIDVRIEPFFQDKNSLFLQVTGSFAPTQDPKDITKRAELVHEITWERLARNIAMEAKD